MLDHLADSFSSQSELSDNRSTCVHNGITAIYASWCAGKGAFSYFEFAKIGSVITAANVAIYYAFIYFVL